MSRKNDMVLDRDWFKETLRPCEKEVDCAFSIGQSLSIDLCACVQSVIYGHTWAMKINLHPQV